jgi:hypothetical protein
MHGQYAGKRWAVWDPLQEGVPGGGVKRSRAQPSANSLISSAVARPPRDTAEWVPGFQGSTTFRAANVERTLLDYARRDEDMSGVVTRCFQAARRRSSGL